MASRRKNQGNLSSRVSTFPIRANPFRITQASSGTGGLTTVESNASLTAANSVVLDPYTIGGRLSLMANLFTEYRFTKLKLTYVPDDTTASGVIETAGGPTTTPSYANRSFAIGLATDPALSTLQFDSLVEMGGKISNTTRSVTLVAGGGALNRWRYTSTTAAYASATTIDFRMVAPLKLYFAYFIASTTATASYGNIVMDATVQFRGSVDNAGVLGATLKVSEPDEKDEEKIDLAASYVLMKKAKPPHK